MHSFYNNFWNAVSCEVFTHIITGPYGLPAIYATQGLTQVALGFGEPPQTGGTLLPSSLILYSFYSQDTLVLVYLMNIKIKFLITPFCK